MENVLKTRLPLIVDFGIRALNRMNFSRTICIPKQAIKNLDLDETDEVKIEMVQDEDEKFLKITPVHNDEDEEDDEDDEDDEEDDEDDEDEEDEK